MAERGRGTAAYIFLKPQELQQALRERSIPEPQLDAVRQLLAAPDPAGMIHPPTYEEVAHIAVYLHDRVGRTWVPNRFWRLIAQGHLTARAIWWHEFQELVSYRWLRVRNPLRVPRSGAMYVQAHARASWEEAHYWEAWAAAEGEEISARAFLHAHPLRRRRELEEILLQLRETWGIDVERAAVLESERAARFYRAKHLTREFLER